MEMEILDQIRAKFKKAAEQYGEKIFNLKDLELRIRHLLNTRGSLEMFAHAEMVFYEKAMGIAKSKEEEIRKKAEASGKIDAIMAAHEEKIKKYRDIFFDPSASIEVRKMVGALTDWYQISFPLVKYLFRGADIWSEVALLQAELERFYVPGVRSIPVFLKHYTDELKTLGPTQKDKAEKKILQTCANSLYKLEKILREQLNIMPPYQKERQISMSAAFDPQAREKWTKYKEYDALKESSDTLGAIIDDFRLRNLTELGFKNTESR